jgi:hypothetical protein
MSEMSPLASLLMSILRTGAIVAAGLLVLFIGIVIYQRIGTTWDFSQLAPDRGFLILLAGMLAMALYLIWSIGKELKKPRQ